MQQDPNNQGGGTDWWSRQPPPPPQPAFTPTPGSNPGQVVTPPGAAPFVNGQAPPAWSQVPPPTTTPPPAGGPRVTTQPIGVPLTGFGSAPTPYASNPNAPVYQPLPNYTPPTWTGGDYVNPTEADLQAMPGYQSGLDAGQQAINRSAAAQGTVLNGGTAKALVNYGTNYADQGYQTLRNNTLDAYKQKYSQFQDTANMDLAARTLNANNTNQTFQNNMNSYLSGNSRTLSDYMTNYTSNRNAELDYWSRLQDVNNTGSNLAAGSYKAP